MQGRLQPRKWRGRSRHQVQPERREPRSAPRAIPSGDQQHLACTQRRHDPANCSRSFSHRTRFRLPRRGQRGTLRALALRWMHGRNRKSSVRPVLGADVIMDAEVGSPTTGAFDVTVMGIVEPDTKPVLFELLSRMMIDVVVDRDHPFGNGPNVPGGAWGVAGHLPPP